MKNPKIVSIFSVLFLVSLAGCDKIPFLSQYFSSEKKDSVAASSQKNGAQSPVDAGAPLPADVLARVDGWTMTILEFNERLSALKRVAPDFDANSLESKQLILEELVRQQLLVKDAEQSGLANDKEIIDAVAEFRKTLLVRQLAEKLVSGIEATEEDAQQYFDQNKDIFVNPAEWRVREIVVSSESAGKEILIELLKGADFAEMAKIHSKSPSASKGGDLGFLAQPPFPEMGKALLSLDVGKASNVFKGPDGYYIVKIEEKKGGEPLVFSDIKEDLIANLTVLKQQQAILEHINKIRQKTVVQINEDLLKE